MGFENHIRIFDPKKDFDFEFSIYTDHFDIMSLCLLDNGNLVSSGKEHTIKIWSIENDKYKKVFEIKKLSTNYLRNLSCKVILLPGNRILSCFEREPIMIWNCDSDSPIITFNNNIMEEITCVLYMENRNLLVCGYRYFPLTVWNMITYQKVTAFIDVFCYFNRGVYQIDDKRIIVGDKQKIKLKLHMKKILMI